LSYVLLVWLYLLAAVGIVELSILLQLRVSQILVCYVALLRDVLISVVLVPKDEILLCYHTNTPWKAIWCR